MKSEKMVEAGKKAWETRKVNSVRKSAGRKAAITKLKKKVSNAILSSASLSEASEKVMTVLNESPQMK